MNMKCKIFVAIKASSLENNINEWLEKNPKIKIRFVQYIATAMAIFYEE